MLHMWASSLDSFLLAIGDLRDGTRMYLKPHYHILPSSTQKLSEVSVVNVLASLLPAPIPSRLLPPMLPALSTAAHICLNWFLKFCILEIQTRKYLKIQKQKARMRMEMNRKKEILYRKTEINCCAVYCISLISISRIFFSKLQPTSSL